MMVVRGQEGRVNYGTNALRLFPLPARHILLNMGTQYNSRS